MEAHKINPDEPEPLYNRAIILDRRGNGDGALAAYDAVIKLNRDSPAAHLHNAEILEALGHSAEALAEYNEIIQIDVEVDRMHLRRADILSAQKDFEGAGRELDAVQSRGDDPISRMNSVVAIARARLALLTGRVQEAKASLMKEGEKDAHRYMLRGLIELFFDNNPESAIDEFVKGIKPGFEYRQAHFLFDETISMLGVAHTLRIDEIDFGLSFRPNIDELIIQLCIARSRSAGGAMAELTHNAE